MGILSFIEMLPLIYNLILSSYNFSNHSPPSYLTDYIVYISYYDILHNHYNHQYPAFLFFFVIIILLLFIVYKYLMLHFKCVQSNVIFKFIVVNFYDVFLFKIGIIFCFDILINELILGNVALRILGVICFFTTFSGVFYHYELHHLFISLVPMRTNCIDNSLLLLFDKYFLILKVIIVFIKNCGEYKKVSFFLNLALFAIHLLSLFHWMILVIFNNFVYIPYLFTVILRIVFCLTTSMLCIYIAIIKIESGFISGFVLMNLLVCAIFICVYLRDYSIRKITKKGNEMGSIIYLINEHLSQNDISPIVQTIVLNHKGNCMNDECKYCDTLTTISKEKMNIEQICNFLFDYISNDKETNNENISIEYSAYYNLCELYVLFLNEKNYIKLLLRFHRIKNMLRYSNKGFQPNKNFLYQNLPQTFTITLELLFEEISNKLIDINQSQKNSYLITVDTISMHINNFLDTIKQFFTINLNTPREVIKLAHSFSLIKQNVNSNFLTSKENKFNYTCILCGYIIEEIFNDKVNKNICFGDIIHSIEDLLVGHYDNDKIILLSFDILNTCFTIQQCGKDFIEYKSQNFEKLFPPCIRKEGKAKMINILEKANNNTFDYYYFNSTKETIERFKMNFVGVPSLSANNNELNLICSYKIQKDHFLVFLNKHITNELVLTSETVSKCLMITQRDIISIKEKKKFISQRDLFSSNGKLHDINTLSKNLSNKLNKQIEINKTQKLTKNINVILKEKISQYDIYLLRGNSKGMLTENIENTGVSNKLMKKTDNEDDAYDTMYGLELEAHYTSAQTGASSSTFTQSSGSTYNKAMQIIKDEQSCKYQKFFRYTYYLISFNVIILMIIIIFLVVELLNNAELEKTFDVITNYYDFQNYFYNSALSLFSLTCNADYLSQIQCVNAFLTYGLKFNKLHGLSDNEKITDYVAREIDVKSEQVLSTLKLWEMNHVRIISKEKDKILNENFQFSTLQDVNNKLTTSTIELTFEQSIKRFTNNINLLTSYSDYLTSPVYPITSDGNGNIDLSNAMLEKKPNKDGTYLANSQKIYYTMVINFQKYILRLMSIGNIIYQYYNDEIDSTGIEVLSFIIGLIILHLLMMVMCVIFIYKFKEIHLTYFIKIFKKVRSTEFVTYYEQKTEYLRVLLEFYRKSPKETIYSLLKIKQKQKNKKIKELKANQERENSAITICDHSDITFNLNELGDIYNKTFINYFLMNIAVLFAIYFIGCLSFYLVIRNSLSNLTLMNTYTKYNYDVSNKLYANLALIQIMAFTNQTDEMLYDYFNNGTNSTTVKKGNFVRESIENVFSLIIKILTLENKSKFFYQLSELIDINCNTLYEKLNDTFVNKLIQKYPQSDYKTFLREYCKSFEPLNTYQNPKLMMVVISYQTSNLLEMFVDRRYETYAYINNCDLIYLLYTETIVLLRPLRRYVYKYLSEIVIQNIISDYTTLMIIFLVFNFLYEVVILLFVKFHIINSIINYSQEIIYVVKAFESL